MESFTAELISQFGFIGQSVKRRPSPVAPIQATSCAHTYPITCEVVSFACFVGTKQATA